MPYLIALAVLIVASVGFTLFQSTRTSTDITNVDSPLEEVLTETPSIIEPTNDDLEIVENEEMENSDDNDNDVTTTEPEISPEPTPAETKPIISEPVVTKPVTPIATSDYRNGTYTSHVTYRTPERDTYALDITLTIKNDMVTASDIVYSQGAQRDKYASRFDGAYESYVVGKNIDAVSLSRVGGASLTTKAFNNALMDIKLQAS